MTFELWCYLIANVGGPLVLIVATLVEMSEE